MGLFIIYLMKDRDKEIDMFRLTIVYTPENAEVGFSEVRIYQLPFHECLQKVSSYNQALVTNVHMEFIGLGKQRIEGK